MHIVANNLDVSVLIATYNRAETLRQTLESMTHLDRNGLRVEFVIIDNNSSDNTKEVIKSFTDKLPIRYLFEARPGKNCALNKALNEASLGELVVFTDDDVEPKQNWLQTIVSVSHRWPDYKVFGGEIRIVWPTRNIPEWVNSRYIVGLAFAQHDNGDLEKPYESCLPFGPNFWVQREVFADGRRFCETVGPRPGSYAMGSETVFLKQLTEEGYDIVYSPFAVVGHRIRAEDVSISSILRRAYRHGRGIAHIRPRTALFDKHPILWCLIRIGAIVKVTFRLTVSLLPLIFQRPSRAVDAIRWIGYNVESLKIAKKGKGT
jgi:glycosyltransferase involved in cell wall biosynthesis